MAKAFDIKNNNVVALANKLEKLHKSAFPLAIRGTLNDVAFVAKNDFVEKEFNEQFIVKKKNFIKSHTIVNKSTNTFNVDQMVSEMGVIKGKSQAGDELILQEFGGTVKKRDYVPTAKARVSKSPRKLIQRPNYRTALKQKNTKAIKDFKSFARAAYFFGRNSVILFNNVLVKIKRISKDGKIKFTSLYSFKSGRSISLSQKPFIEPSGIEASKQIPDLFNKNAQKQINRILK